MEYAIFQNKKIDKIFKIRQLVAFFTEQAEAIRNGKVPESLFMGLSFQSVHQKDKNWSSQMMGVYQNYYGQPQDQSNLLFQNSPLANQISNSQQQIGGYSPSWKDIFGGLF